MCEVISIGHDIAEISRIESAHLRFGEKFLCKVYTAQEIDYCMRKKNPYPSLAARFAVKEATSKALSCGIGKQFSWRSVSTVHGTSGEPLAILDALGLQRMEQIGARHILLSITHTRDIASAVVILTA